MNSNTVLNKIMQLLSAKADVAMTYAKLADGTIVESPTFDVGEALEVVTEEGKTPAPDGEHELRLRDEEGNEVLIRVITKDGVITERENVEELQEETVKVDEEKEKEMGLAEEGEVEVEVETPAEEVSEEVADALLDALVKKVEEMSYRIEELSSKLQKMEEEVVKEEEDVEMEEDEEELPKLDGAPVMASKVEITKTNKNKIENSQNLFLSKLYKNK
jgi:hypothetical protein